MAKITLTDRFIKALKPNGRRQSISDAQCPGLALRVSPGGAKSFSVVARDPTGRQVRATIGEYPTYSLAGARRRTPELIKQIHEGVNPKQEAARRARAEADKITLGEYSDKFLSGLDDLRRLDDSSRRLSPGYRSNLRTDLSAAIAEMEAADTPLEDIGRGHLHRMLDLHRDRPARAHLRLSAISRLMEEALDAELIERNPCRDLSKKRRPKKPKPRTGQVTHDQLTQLWESAESAGELYADLLRIWSLVPARIGELLAMRFDELDLDSGRWLIPADKMKGGDEHHMPLGRKAVEILRGRAAPPASDYVFANPRTGQPLSHNFHVRKKIQQRTGVEGWAWHDIRRSFMNEMAGSFDLDLLDGIIAHAQSETRSEVRKAYLNSRRWPERLIAIQAWESYVLDSGSNVVDFESGVRA